MQTVDIVIGALGFVAVAATVLGVVFYDEIAGDRDIIFPEEAVALEQDTETVSAGSADFEFVLPENATKAELDIEVVFSGQAIQGGTATIEVVVTGPDGSTSAPVTQTMTIGPGATSATTTFPVEYRWADPPNATTGDPATYDQDVLTWAEPLKVTVTVDGPGEVLPVAEYNFDAVVGGDVLAYRAQAKPVDVQVN